MKIYTNMNAKKTGTPSLCEGMPIILITYILPTQPYVKSFSKENQKPHPLPLPPLPVLSGTYENIC